MKNSKLIRVIQSFSGGEIKEMNRFLASSFFNQRKDVKLLFEKITANLSSETEDLTKTTAFKVVYPQEQYNITKIDLLMSYLFRLLQQYLTWKEFSKDTFQQKLYCAKGYRNRGLPLDFQQSIEKLELSLTQQSIQNAEYYSLLYQIQWEKYQSTKQTKPEKETERWDMSDTFDIAYLATKLKHQCLLLAHQMVYRLDRKEGFLAEIIDYLGKENYLKIPAINLYYHCYLMLSQPKEDTYFFTFKDLLFELDHHFEASEKRILLLMGINYCVRQTNNGQFSFLTQLLELYKGGLKNQYLLEKGVLSRFTFHNIVGTGLATKNYKWIESFIQKYKGSLEKKDRESAYSFSLARLEYHRKNYDVVLQLLQKSNYRDMLLNLAAKTLLLKIYAELDEDDLLFAHLEAMQRYIRRKQVIGYHKKNYLNIIKLTKKMRSLNFFDKKIIQEFIKTIESTEVLTEREWFIEQLEGL